MLFQLFTPWEKNVNDDIRKKIRQNEWNCKLTILLTEMEKKWKTNKNLSVNKIIYKIKNMKEKLKNTHSKVWKKYFKCATTIGHEELLHIYEASHHQTTRDT